MGNVSDIDHKFKRQFEITREALQMPAWADRSLSHVELRIWGVITAKKFYRPGKRSADIDICTAEIDIREIAKLCNLSKSATGRGFQALVKRGYLTPPTEKGSRVYGLHVVPTCWDKEEANAGEGLSQGAGTGLSQHAGTACPTQAGTHKPLTPLKEPLMASLRSAEEKQGVGERALRAREQEEGPSSPRQTSSAEPVPIDTPQQKAWVEAQRQEFHRLVRAQRMPWEPVPRRDGAHRSNQLLRDDLARRKYINERR